MTSRQKTESQTQYHHYPALPTRHSARTLQQSSHPYIQTRPSRASRASTGSTSRSVASGSSSSEVEISFYGYVETVLDALLLVEGLRRGSIQGLTGRIPANQRNRLIQSGSTFIFVESSTDIRRWTDGRRWTPSRVGGEYLVYREPTNEEPAHQPDIPEGSELARRMRSLVVSLMDGSRTEKGWVRPEGICKRTIVLSSETGESYHVISYYHHQDVLEGRLNTPSETPWLAVMKENIAQDLLNPNLFKRNPPRVSRDPNTGLLRYEGEDATLESSSPSPAPVLMHSQELLHKLSVASYTDNVSVKTTEPEIAYGHATSPPWSDITLPFEGIGLLPATSSPISTAALLPTTIYSQSMNMEHSALLHSRLSRQGSAQTDSSLSQSDFTTDLFIPMNPTAPFIFPPMHGNGTISPALLNPATQVALDSYFIGFGDDISASSLHYLPSSF